MKYFIPRLLLALSAAILALGGVIHATAYVGKASASINAANVPPFLGAELKVLWLADSTTLLAVALIFAFITAKPASAASVVMVLLALIPAASAMLLYLFLGPFYAAHMLMAASVMAVIAGLLMSKGPDSTTHYVNGEA